MSLLLTYDGGEVFRRAGVRRPQPACVSPTVTGKLLLRFACVSLPSSLSPSVHRPWFPLCASSPCCCL